MWAADLLDSSGAPFGQASYALQLTLIDRQAVQVGP